MKREIKEKKSVTKRKERNASFNLVEVIVIIIMTSLIVGVSTGVIVYKNYKEEPPEETKDTKYYNELKKAYENIINGYVEKVDESKLVNAAIEGMYNYLGDPYTSYIDEDGAENLNDRLNGYTGIGVEITKVNEGILVVNVFENSPAAKAGIEAGDILIKLNGTDITKASASEVSNSIKTSSQDSVELTFLRSNITITKTVNVKSIDVPTVTKNNIDGTGYIKIDTFSSDTYNQFKNALEELEQNEINNLIIDVRNNGGGYLNSAVEIAELFIEKGKNIYGLQNKKEITFYQDKTKTKRNYKVAVIVNGSSASASEILASALKESYGATIVGTTSYGKGTVQETSELASGGMIKYTTAYWLTPNGNSINNKGIKPDIEIEYNYVENDLIDNDIQIQGALNAVK